MFSPSSPSDSSGFQISVSPAFPLRLPGFSDSVSLASDDSSTGLNLPHGGIIMLTDECNQPLKEVRIILEDSPEDGESISPAASPGLSLSLPLSPSLSASIHPNKPKLNILTEEPGSIANSARRPPLKLSLSLADEGDADDIEAEDSDSLEKKFESKRGAGKFLSVAAQFNPRASYEVTDDGTLKTDLFSINSIGFKRRQAEHISEAAHKSLGEFNSSTLVEMGVLGRGAGGRVVKALHKPSLTVVALKCIDVNDRGKRSQLGKELKELDTDYCPHVVSFYSAFYEHGSVKLALEYMNRGSLQSIIDKNLKLNEIALSSVARQALLGLGHLHKNRKLHRDIKPGNMLLNHHGVVKLSDFGLIAELRDEKTKAQTFVGTLIYMSPERLSSSGYSYPADVWSLGMSLITLATGQYPMSTESGYWGLLTELNKHPPPELGPEFSPELRDFVSRMLQKDGAKRWTVPQLLEHPFIVNGPELEEAVTEFPKQWRMFEPDAELVARLKQRRHLKILKYQHLQKIEAKKNALRKNLENSAAKRGRRPSISMTSGIANSAQQDKRTHGRKKSISVTAEQIHAHSHSHSRSRSNSHLHNDSSSSGTPPLGPTVSVLSPSASVPASALPPALFSVRSAAENPVQPDPETASVLALASDVSADIGLSSVSASVRSPSPLYDVSSSPVHSHTSSPPSPSAAASASASALTSDSPSPDLLDDFQLPGPASPNLRNSSRAIVAEQRLEDDPTIQYSAARDSPLVFPLRPPSNSTPATASSQFYDDEESPRTVAMGKALADVGESEPSQPQIQSTVPQVHQPAQDIAAPVPSASASVSDSESSVLSSDTASPRAMRRRSLARSRRFSAESHSILLAAAPLLKINQSEAGDKPAENSQQNVQKGSDQEKQNIAVSSPEPIAVEPVQPASAAPSQPIDASASSLSAAVPSSLPAIHSDSHEREKIDLPLVLNPKAAAISSSLAVSHTAALPPRSPLSPAAGKVRRLQPLSPGKTKTPVKRIGQNKTESKEVEKERSLVNSRPQSNSGKRRATPIKSPPQPNIGTGSAHAAKAQPRKLLSPLNAAAEKARLNSNKSPAKSAASRGNENTKNNEKEQKPNLAQDANNKRDTEAEQKEPFDQGQPAASSPLVTDSASASVSSPSLAAASDTPSSTASTAPLASPPPLHPPAAAAAPAPGSIVVEPRRSVFLGSRRLEAVAALSTAVKYSIPQSELDDLLIVLKVLHDQHRDRLASIRADEAPSDLLHSECCHIADQLGLPEEAVEQEFDQYVQVANRRS